MSEQIMRGVYSPSKDNDNEDLDRIDVITAYSSDSSSLNSQHIMHTNIEANSGFDDIGEQIELISETPRLEQNTQAALKIACTPTNMVRRWSLNISRLNKDKRSIREKTIYRLASRKVFEVDGKLLSTTSVDPEAEIDQLVSEIEQYDNLMQDTVLGEQNRLETLRSLPQSLATKRLLKQKLASTIEQQLTEEERTDWRKCFWNSLLGALLKLWLLLRIIFNGVEIWYDSLKTIDGHYGSNVGSYFKFLRWLFVLNMLLFVCTFGFITLPQMLYVNTENTNESSIVITHIKEDWHKESKDDWQFFDFLTGEGVMKSSIMFYGSYTNETLVFDNSKSHYSLPHAYYMTMLLLYLCTFVLISISVARSYRKSFIAMTSGVHRMYATKIFCSWDYGIADAKAADLKHFAIFTELKEVLNEMSDCKKKLHVFWRILIYCSQLIAHLLVGAMIAGLGIAIWILLKEFGDSNANSPWESLYVATAVNFSMLFLQIIFDWIAKLEDYRSPRHTLHVTLMRNFVLETVVIGVLVYYWLTKKYGECWETSIGQEVYRLIVSDFFISLLLLPLVNSLRVFVFSRYMPICGHPEFDISQKSLGLVFNQSLLWVGLLFAPLLAAVMVVKMLLMFYVNKAMLLHLCKSPRHVWRSAQTHTFYLLFTFLSLLGVIIALGYIMTQIPVSTKCGPFRDYAFMFQIFIDGVLKLRQNEKAWRFLMFLIRPAVVGVILIIMAIMVYYLRAKSRAHCMMVKLLKDMIYVEAKDKQFLLMNIAKITKEREHLLEHRASSATLADRLAETSNTWRFERSNRNNRASAASMHTSSTAVSVSDECILRSRNV